MVKWAATLPAGGHTSMWKTLGTTQEPNFVPYFPSAIHSKAVAHLGSTNVGTTASSRIRLHSLSMHRICFDFPSLMAMDTCCMAFHV